MTLFSGSLRQPDLDASCPWLLCLRIPLPSMVEACLAGCTLLMWRDCCGPLCQLPCADGEAGAGAAAANGGTSREEIMTAGFIGKTRLSRVPMQHGSYWDLAFCCEGRCSGTGWVPESCIDYLTDAGPKWPVRNGRCMLYAWIFMPMNPIPCKGWGTLCTSRCIVGF